MFNQGRHHAQPGSDSVSDTEIVPAAISDTGCERELNEDRYSVIDSSSGVTWIVCDGMGGSAGGELAAQLAIDSMRRDLESQDGRMLEVALKTAILEANRVIVLRRQNPTFSGMGTTVVAAMISGQEVCIGHVGDSRAYLIRDGAIQQLTIDHTYVQELVERGQISENEALNHPQAHILTRCLGAEPGLEVVLKKFWLWPVAEGAVQDFMFLCSDGLYSLVNDDEIASIVCKNTPQRACIELVDIARSRGGFDNITLAIVPLEGQLRNERPAVTENKEIPVKKSTARVQQPKIKRFRVQSPFKSIALIMILSLLSATVTTAYFLFIVAK
jgi:PPM family protein phosphatase